jgi:CrcB protein
MTPLLALVVVLTGAAAAGARYAVSLLFAPRVAWAVLIVNVTGSVIGGAVLGLAERAAIGADLRVILLTGLCGGLTTFSTFSVETVQLLQSGRARSAFASVTANLVLGVGAAALAYLALR